MYRIEKSRITWCASELMDSGHSYCVFKKKKKKILSVTKYTRPCKDLNPGISEYFIRSNNTIMCMQVNNSNATLVYAKPRTYLYNVVANENS